MDIPHIDLDGAVEQSMGERKGLAIELVVVLALQGRDRSKVSVFVLCERVVFIVVRLVIFGLFDLVLLLGLATCATVLRLLCFFGGFRASLVFHPW